MTRSASDATYTINKSTLDFNITHLSTQFSKITIKTLRNFHSKRVSPRKIHRNKQPLCGHHPRRRPRRISPPARLPSNRGCEGIPRSLSVRLLDGHAEVIPAELAPRVRPPVPKQLIPARRHSAECRQPPHPVLSQRHIAICRRSASGSTTHSPPMRSQSPLRPRRISPAPAADGTGANRVSNCKFHAKFSGIV